MKKLIFGLMILGMANVVHSATNATLVLTGTVAQVLDLTIDSVLSTKTVVLDLHSNQTDFLVGTVNVRSNANNGYKLTVASQNSNQLLHTGGTSNIPYSLKVGGVSVVGSEEISSPSQTTQTDYPVTISYTGQPAISLVEGTYEDIVTFTLTAN